MIVKNDAYKPAKNIDGRSGGGEVWRSSENGEEWRVNDDGITLGSKRHAVIDDRGGENIHKKARQLNLEEKRLPYVVTAHV